MRSTIVVGCAPSAYTGAVENASLVGSTSGE